MERSKLLYCIFLGLLLSSTSAVKTLKNIKDLKKLSTNFTKEFPQHGLMLLHWFANNVDINQNGVVQLNFDPTQGTHGVSCYRSEISGRSADSSESSNGRYYALGDLAHKSARKLPFYVVQDFHNALGLEHKNMDRLLVKVQSRNPKLLDKVYVTQHLEHRNQGDHTEPQFIYEISIQLLVQIQALNKDTVCESGDPRLDFSVCEFQKYQQKVEKVQMVYPKTPGLAWFLILAGYNTDRRVNILSQASFCSDNPAGRSTCSPNGYLDALLVGEVDALCYEHHKLMLEVKSTSNGYAKIVWSGVPEHIARLMVYIGLFRDGTEEEPLKEYLLNGRTYGAIDTNVPLNAGLQVRIFQHETVRRYVFLTASCYMTLWKGPEFDEANRILPTNVRGYQVGLQLYTKGGYACARLYIKKSFRNWKNVFDNSWVAFYTSSADDNGKYRKYEWVVNFDKRPEEACPLDYNIYEYESSLAIGPGVQARFMLTKHFGSEKARTVPWEEQPTVRN